MRAFVLSLIATLVLAPAAQESRQPTQFNPAERARCLARGGQVATAGLSGNDMCALPFADAGRVCTSGSQCLGDCLLDEASLRGKPPRNDARARGRCQALNYPYGCRNLVENGRLTVGLCID